MIKELVLKGNSVPDNYPKLGERVTKVIYHKKDSDFGKEHGIEDGGYCVHFASGHFHVIPKDVVAVAIYE